jgi:hypothetical protein
MKLVPYLIVLGFSTSVVAADAMQEDTGQAASTPSQAVSAPADTATDPATAEMESQTPTSEATATEEVATDTAATDQEQAGFSRGSVVRSIFTSSIQDREPIDKLDNTAEAERVFYFTELRDMSGQTAIHRWEYDGKVMAEVKFDVRGPRWRVWSSKSFVPGWTGDWKVSVLNGAGETISEEMISLTSVPAEEQTTEAMPAATEATDMSAPASSDPGQDASQPATDEFQPPVSPELLQ